MEFVGVLKHKTSAKDSKTKLIEAQNIKNYTETHEKEFHEKLREKKEEIKMKKKQMEQDRHD